MRRSFAISGSAHHRPAAAASREAVVLVPGSICTLQNRWVDQNIQRSREAVHSGATCQALMCVAQRCARKPDAPPIPSRACSTHGPSTLTTHPTCQCAERGSELRPPRTPQPPAPGQAERCHYAPGGRRGREAPRRHADEDAADASTSASAASLNDLCATAAGGGGVGGRGACSRWGSGRRARSSVVHTAALLVVAVVLSAAVVAFLLWNAAAAESGRALRRFVDGLPASSLRVAADGQLVKITGVCRAVPQEERGCHDTSTAGTSIDRLRAAVKLLRAELWRLMKSCETPGEM
ncbi:hypothetical protein HU200_001368 [Digitaria exilis]|uniref:Uncharacterized protein n=1 Tax=Digitaria exilis TaxID=1010633 RepID=A0A835FYX2_9POAL|nr:hypothetical protein HU200_001368 [Digitaria exilis]